MIDAQLKNGGLGKRAAAIKEYLARELRALSSREKWIVALAGASLLLLVVFKVYEAASGAFLRQRLEMLSAENERRDLPLRLARFQALLAKKRAIEERFREVEVKEGVRSHMEKLLRKRAGVNPGYSIRDLPAKQFGGDYEQNPYSVRFNSSSLEGIVGFLDDLAYGSQPLILSELEITRSRTGDRFDVTVGASSIRHIK